MDDVKQVGKKLGKTKNESAINTRRGAENFPAPERAVQNFNKLFNYKKTFVTEGKVPVYANLQVQDITTPCTVNPPILDIWCRAKFGIYSYPEPASNCNSSSSCETRPFTMLDNNGAVDPTTGEENLFYLNEDRGSSLFGAITVPQDGCYGITLSSGAWGVSYFPTHNQWAKIYRMVPGPDNLWISKIIVSTAKPTTGFTWTLGPAIWHYPSITYLYYVVEAKAGDKILATLGDDGMNECFCWYSGCLRGFYVYQDTTQIRIDLIASAESV